MKIMKSILSINSLNVKSCFIGARIYSKHAAAIRLKPTDYGPRLYYFLIIDLTSKVYHRSCWIEGRILIATQTVALSFGTQVNHIRCHFEGLATNQLT